MQFNKKRNNTIKNKRKSKSRTRRIKRPNNLKGGGLGGLLKQMYDCYVKPSQSCAVNSFSAIDHVAGMPSSISDLTSYIEIAKQLLEFCKRINTDVFSSQYSKLISTFKRGIEELDDMIRFLETNNIIGELNIAKPSENLIGFVNEIVQQIRNSSLSDVTNAGKIAIWANWYRSKLENMVSQLTTTLTQINSIHIQLPLNPSPPAPLASHPASPTLVNDMSRPVPVIHKPSEVKSYNVITNAGI